MTSRDFVYWLQGFFEIGALNGKPQELSSAQVEMIKRHLALVFKHEIDPSFGDDEHRRILQETHDGVEKEKTPLTKEKIEELLKKSQRADAFTGRLPECQRHTKIMC